MARLPASQSLPDTNDNEEYLSYQETEVSPLSKEVVIGFVGYAGSGCSAVAKRLQTLLEVKGYEVFVVKLSSLLEYHLPPVESSEHERRIDVGKKRFSRAQRLQDIGDSFRQRYGNSAVALMAIQKIKELRGENEPGQNKIAFLLDSIKHYEEVDMLRKVYDKSFRLVAIHCEKEKRQERLIGKPTETNKKYAGVSSEDVLRYMERDEKDHQNLHGQQVREAFYQADFFVDNNLPSETGESLTGDLQRFVNLILGSSLVRPNQHERAMYHAHTASLQSACLSRQVGAALMKEDGTVVATGTNDVPKYGGGVYDEDSTPDNRCFAWEWDYDNEQFVGCHNQRKKNELRGEIAEWLATEFASELAAVMYPRLDGQMDVEESSRADAERKIRKIFSEGKDRLDGLPGIGDIIEYSRSIHAEMNALLSAARYGISAIGATLFTTTYPCHNCARHLVTAGISEVRYIEPYVKGLAAELHYDSIVTEQKAAGTQKQLERRMKILPFTGVGPRMYDDFFRKRGEVKDGTGAYVEPEGGHPVHAVRIRDLLMVEEGAVQLFEGAIE